MREMKVKVTTKVMGQEFTDYIDYTEPESLEEAVDIDGDDNVLKVYLVKRKTNFQDKARKAKTAEIEQKLAKLFKSGKLDGILSALEGQQTE